MYRALFIVSGEAEMCIRRFPLRLLRVILLFLSPSWCHSWENIINQQGQLKKKPIQPTKKKNKKTILHESFHLISGETAKGQQGGTIHQLETGVGPRSKKYVPLRTQIKGLEGIGVRKLALHTRTHAGVDRTRQQYLQAVF